MNKRDGIWIPIDIIKDNNLDWINKVLLSEIFSYSKLEKGCFASNDTFAELLNIHRGNVSKRISFLEEEGYINVVLLKEGEKRTKRVITPHEGVSDNAQRNKRKRTKDYANTHKGVSDNAQTTKRERCTNITTTITDIITDTNSVTSSVNKTEQITQDEWINNYLNKNQNK
jgi:Helix-turn-helix domain